MVSLSDSVRFIQDAIDGGGRVLVHSLVVSTAIIIVCYCKPFVVYRDSLRRIWPVMSNRMMSITEAADIVSDRESK